MSSAPLTEQARSTTEIANELASLVREGRNLEAIERFYSPDIVSVESTGSEEMPREMRGIEAVRGKNQWWFDNNIVHSTHVAGPFIADDQFALRYDFDTTFKPVDQRVQMSEMALYTVRDGRIVQEEFFYNAPGQ